MIQWASPKNEIVWKFPSKRIFWNEEIVIDKNQAAGIFSGLGFFSHAKMHGVYFEGTKSIRPADIPSIFLEFSPDSIKNSIDCNVVFCSTEEFEFSGKIYAGESGGSAVRVLEANVQCILAIFDASLFLKKIVGEKKKTSTASFQKYLKKCLADALVGAGKNNLNDEMKINGISLLDFRYQTLKDEWVGFGC